MPKISQLVHIDQLKNVLLLCIKKERDDISPLEKIAQQSLQKEGIKIRSRTIVRTNLREIVHILEKENPEIIVFSSIRENMDDKQFQHLVEIVRCPIFLAK